MANEVTEQKATTSVDLPPRRMTLLLGTFGPESGKRALVRLRNGDVTEVGPGDSLPEGPVVAVEPGRVGVTQGGETRWILEPS